MDYTVRTDGDEDELRSLAAWLNDEPGLRATPRPAPIGPGEQGGLLDAIQLVITDGVPLASLYISIRQWRDSRPKRPNVTVETPDGERHTVPEATDTET